MSDIGSSSDAGAQPPITSAPEVIADRYELHRVIGSGAMASVYEATDRVLGRSVAVKLLHPELDADPSTRRRFEDEAQAWARIVNSNVVVLFDSGEDDGHAYLVSECLPGTTLADEMSLGPAEPRRAEQVATQLLSALSAAHEVGVLHRDIKPANVLVDADGSIKVADFGIAKTADSADMTAVGELVGTVRYLAPERLRGELATTRADIYAAGVLLHELVTGERAFDAETPAAVMQSIERDGLPALLGSASGCPPGLARAIDQACQRSPSNRPASAQAMLDLLVGSDPTVSMPTVPVADQTQTIPLHATPVGSLDQMPQEVTEPLPPIRADAGTPSTDPTTDPIGERARAAASRNRKVIIAAVVVMLIVVFVVLASRDDNDFVDSVDAPTGAPLDPAVADAFDRLEELVGP